MNTAKQYQEYADECLASAKDALNEEERELYVRMAQDWLRAATLLSEQDREQVINQIAESQKKLDESRAVQHQI